ncbi:MAG: T9SS type A sorting domain-containing protein, partial [Lewinellaceae bacterium]|nr:T9SS type A sorting domain-containing protein [Lewinellaceae bacterium]
KIGTTFGLEFDNVGAKVKVNALVKSSNAWKTEDGTEKGLTTGYSLKDDDPGDAFTVDVAMDTFYKTPVFKIRAGQSSCPWEPGTANREGPNLQLGLGSQFTAVNVPATEPAVFNLNLGNLSASNEDWTYGFTAIASSNPDGAVIKLNGTTLNNNTIKYIVPYGTSVPITLTVERGPVAYEYDSLMVALVSECEFERNLGLSLPLGVGDDTLFFSGIPISVDFIRPCSEVNITVPEQNWAVINNDPLQPGTKRRITVSGYDLNSTDFQLIRVQYRRADGNGAWINIVDTFERFNPNWSGFVSPPDTPLLFPDFTQFIWETAGLSDGDYEIHAWAVCTGDASDKPGFSQIIKGRIDREPPSLVGVPQPSDGVYHVGDEISFTFNQHVNCDSLKQDFIGIKRNLGLYNTTTNTLIDVNATCYENKIVLDPTFDNQFYENKILRAELRGIQDLVGNKTGALTWEFFVDRNELAWLTDSLGITKFEAETKTVTANIHNRGGYPVPFKILDAPDWLHVSPNQGTLAANEIRPINFTVDPNLAFGRWSDTIVLETQTGQNPFFMGGSEPLPVGVRVVCRPPYSPVNLTQYQNTMNMILQGQHGGRVLDGWRGHCGGIHRQPVARLRQRAVRATGERLAGLSDHIRRPRRYTQAAATRSVGRFRVSALRFSSREFYLPARQHHWQDGKPAGGAHGGAVAARSAAGLWLELAFIQLSLPEQQPGFRAGYAPPPAKRPDAQPDGVFAIHGRLVWLFDQPEQYHHVYLPRRPARHPAHAGYGHRPRHDADPCGSRLELDRVYSELRAAGERSPGFLTCTKRRCRQKPVCVCRIPESDCRLGGQPEIPLAAQRLSDQISPGRHADLPAAAQSADGKRNGGTRRNGNTARPLDGEPTQFEHTNTLIGMIRSDGTNATTSNMELGAFAGGEVRGTAQAIYIEPLDAHLFFLTTYANTAGELLRFKLYNDADGSVRDLTETMYFAPNQHQGSIQSPVPFELQTTSAGEDSVAALGFDVQPNPFSSETTLRFNLPKAEEVTLTISDAQGREVVRKPISAVAGQNVATWNGRSDTGSWLSSGVYTVRLQTAAGSVVRKVVLQRLP